jgi:hypothetical protein
VSSDFRYHCVSQGAWTVQVLFQPFRQPCNSLIFKIGA